MPSYPSPSTKPKPKSMTRHHSSPFPTCFRPPHAHPPSPNLTTSLYQSHLGLFSLTWSRSFFSRSLHLLLHPSSSPPSPSSPPPSFHLSLNSFSFWSKHGSKTLLVHQTPEHLLSLLVVWDFTRARFGSGPEPESGYYIAIVSPSTSSPLLFVGDLLPSFHSKLKSYTSNNTTPTTTIVTKNSNNDNNNSNDSNMCESSLVVRREHVCGAQFYTTKATLGGKAREILIEVNKNVEDDPRLVIRFDNKRVIQVKHLKWKFRGSERFEVDRHPVQLSWDVYNWLFDDGGGGGGSDEGYALFTFRFEAEYHNHDSKYNSVDGCAERGQMWSQDSCGLSYERKKMKKKLVVKTSSSSSSSLSSASSSGSSSVMEWESVEENELKAPTGFSLLVYAWKN